jgi:hypothetical protein
MPNETEQEELSIRGITTSFDREVREIIPSA